MGYEDIIAANMKDIQQILSPKEEVLLVFYGEYREEARIGYDILRGTCALTNLKILFRGAPVKWDRPSKKVKLIRRGILEVPYSIIAEITLNKKEIKIKLPKAQESESGKKPGRMVKMSILPARLKKVPATGTKEAKTDYLSRVQMIYNKIEELMGRSNL